MGIQAMKLADDRGRQSQPPSHTKDRLRGPTDTAGRVGRITFNTKQVDPEEALKRSEELYSRLVNSLDCIVWEADAATRQFIFVSQRAEQILGHPAAQWLEPGFGAQHVHPHDLDWWVRCCKQAAENSGDHEFEYRMIAADGRIVWLHDVVSALVERDGSVRLRGVMMDVTPHKHAQAVLEESEARFRLLFERSCAGMDIADVGGRILSANPAFCELLGYSPAELQDRNLLDLIHPEDRWKTAAYFEEAQRKGEATCDIEERYLRRDGEVVWCCTSAAFLAAPGRPACSVGVHLDISVQKRAETLLRESEERFRIIANDTPAYLWMSSELTENSFINRSLAVFLGVNDTALGARWSDFVHPDDRERVRQKFLNCIAARHDYFDEFRVRRFDGEYRWMLDQGVPRFGPQGNFLGYAGSLTDVTEERRAAQLAREACDRLARELAERTRAEREIAALSRRLIDAQEQERARIARELHDDLGQQVAALGIALSRIRQQIPRDRQEAHRQADRACRRIAEIGATIHNLSRQLHPSVLERGGLVPALESLSAELQSLTQVASTIEADGDFHDLPANVSLGLFRIAQEGLQNVWKHSGAKQARIRLSRSEHHVRLEIVDEGRGFDILENSTQGLGLISMRERARLLGGTFSVQSFPGRGAVLTAVLPVLRPSHERPRTAWRRAKHVARKTETCK